MIFFTDEFYFGWTRDFFFSSVRVLPGTVNTFLGYDVKALFFFSLFSLDFFPQRNV